MTHQQIVRFRPRLRYLGNLARLSLFELGDTVVTVILFVLQQLLLIQYATAILSAHDGIYGFWDALLLQIILQPS